MRIAIQNSLPNHPVSAEAEWRHRALIALGRLGHEAVEVVTSDDIEAYRPDCVLVTHEFSAKITEFPTIGLNWSPPAFFADDAVRRRAVLSLDGHLCGSDSIAHWVDDLMVGSGKRSVLGPGLMLPSTQDCGPAAPLPRDPAIFYAGVHWDGSRHGAIFRALADRVKMHFYGPPEAWRERAADYQGTLPFDGISVVEAIRHAGIALCLHKSAHRDADCPSMRLFEAAAAGALIITDDFRFPRQWFRDSVLYVDAALPAPAVADQIVAHVAWARQSPVAAARLAQRSNELFRERLTLEAMLSTLPAFVDTVRGARGFDGSRAGADGRPPLVEYVVRVGSRPAAMIRRALESLACQTYGSIGVVLVQFHPVEGLDALIEAYRPRFASMRHVVIENDGNRSTSWWAGLRAVRADFFGMLDDDDTLFSNHVATVMAHLLERAEFGFVYSGIVRIQDEPGHFAWGPQFNGPAQETIEERRDLFCIESEHFSNLLPTTNIIGHNTWICRRALLDEAALVDPRIEWGEDVYFTALMAERTRFHFTAMATACWHWRSTSKDNWTLSHSERARVTSLRRWGERLQKANLPIWNSVSLPPELARFETHADDNL